MSGNVEALVQKLISKVELYQPLVDSLTQKLKSRDLELSALRTELKVLKAELASSKTLLRANQNIYMRTILLFNRLNGSCGDRSDQ